MKKLTVMLLIAAMVLGVSACGNSANKENTATESQMSTQEAEDLDAKINELTQKENSILENHKALWEKVFNSIDKSTVKDATATNYGDFLANSLDKIKDKFTDDELKSLKEDVEEIKKLEDELPAYSKSSSAQTSGSGKIRRSKSSSISSELNLLGMTTDEAIVELDKYLDDAYLAHLSPVRIVHGKGTGALRKAVHQYLRRQKHVASYRLGEYGEGDAGVTIVEFK